MTAMPWYRDLELERHGARYVEPELNVAMLLPDGRSLQWWTDLERTVESFAEFSRQDAGALRRWVDEFRPDRRADPASRSPVAAAAAGAPPRDPAAASALGRRLLEVSALSPLEFVQARSSSTTWSARGCCSSTACGKSTCG